MDKPNSKAEKPKVQRRYSQQQYDMLKRCYKNQDMTEWNECRKEHPKEDILLEGRDFTGFYLKKANFMTGGRTYKENQKEIEMQFTGEVHLEGAIFEWADLQKVVFTGANMNSTKFWSANAKGARFSRTSLVGAELGEANFENCDFCDTILENADFSPSFLNGAKFTDADLRGCSMRGCVVNGSTRFWNCHINHYSKSKRFTDLTGTALDNVIITSGEKQLLEYNIRRQNWEEWYTKHILLKWPVRWFWCVSDYGINTWRIIGWFLGLAMFFAVVYSNLAYWFPPGIVSNLEVEPHLPIWHYSLLLLLRPIYFSVVTMTTLGFGDMYANVQSIWGHILLTFQVILGYVLLGALITRFAVLFTAGGPAGKFADEEEKKDKTQQEAR